MKHLRTLIASICIITSCTFAQQPIGHYEGAVSRDGSVQLVKADLDTVAGRIVGTFDIPELMDYEVPIPPAVWKGDTLVMWFNYGNFLCRYSPETDEITGLSEKWLPKIRLHLKKEGSKIVRFRRDRVKFANKNVSLQGTLFLPSSNARIPFVVLIHGSGDVDQNSAYYHSLGYALAENGIGVLLYDKRGCGGSGGDWKVASMRDLANDAVAAMTYLRNRDDIKVSKVGFLGTSQGGWITAIAANTSRQCDFAILNVGPSVSVFDQDIHRVKYSMKSDGVTQTAIDSAVEYTRLYFRYAQNGSEKNWKSLFEYADLIRARDWSGYVNIPKDQNEFLWWRNNDYDPTEDLKRVRCPVLSIFGELDVLVPPAENEARMDSLLRLSGSPHTIKIVPHVGHDELTFQGLNGNDWQWPDVYWQWRKRPPIIIETIINWINMQ
jgi:uncharacterized protein